MKKIILIASILVLLGCGSTYTEKNEAELSKWIQKSPKPIVVLDRYIDVWTGDVKYLLMNANNEVFISKYVEFWLPDTINSVTNKKKE